MDTRINPEVLKIMSEMIYKIKCANRDGEPPQNMTVGDLRKIIGFLPDKMEVLCGGVDEFESGQTKEVYDAQCFMFLEKENDENEYGLVLLGRKVRVRPV